MKTCSPMTHIHNSHIHHLHPPTRDKGCKCIADVQRYFLVSCDAIKFSGGQLQMEK